MPEKAGARAVIDACKRCLGYVKTFTRLQGCPPDTVMLEDLASVALDVAALEQGYTRPAGAGYPLDVTVTANSASATVFRLEHMNAIKDSSHTFRPADVCRALLAALEASEGRRRKRKRDQTPDAFGLAVKRDLLQRVGRRRPAAGCLRRLAVQLSSHL